MKNILRVAIAVCFTPLFISCALAQQPVPPPPKPANDAPANAEVLKLLRAAMPESVVLDKIRAITDKFDTSIDALITLKQAGATEAELKAILAQGTVPAAAPADTGPSLAETMQFIQEKMNDIGKVAWVDFLQDAKDGSTWTETFTTELNNVIVDQNQCRFSYHRKVTDNGETDSDQNYFFSLRDVQDIIVKPEEQNQTDWIAQNGKPNIIVTSTSPSIATLIVHRPRGEMNTFRFTDANLADRVAKAMQHAVELCGGGNRDKF
jgi:hypothetical protein